MGKPKPLPAVAEVPPEALAEDRRRAEAMVALVKEMTKGEDRRERLLRRARPSDQKTLLKRFERERARDAQRIRELSQEREALLRASVREPPPRRRRRRRRTPAATPTTSRRRRGRSTSRGPRRAPKNLMTAQKLAQEKEIIDKFNRLCRPGPPRRARAAPPPASTRRTARRRRRHGAADRRADGEADAPRAAPGHRRGGVGAPASGYFAHRAVRLPDAGQAVVGAVRRDDRLLRDGRLARGRAAAAAARGAAAAALRTSPIGAPWASAHCGVEPL